mgnify:CR=1 FL=1
MQLFEKFGLIPEFIGRLPIIATLKDLDKEALIEILVEPKNSLVKQYQKLFEIDGVELVFEKEALEVLERLNLGKCKSEKLDCYYDRNKLNNLLKEYNLKKESQIIKNYYLLN